MRRASGLGLVLAAGVLARLAYFWLVARVLPVSGDEQDYFHGAPHLDRVLTHLGSLGAPDVAAAVDRVIGDGWFLPGMTLLVLPSHLLGGDLAAARLWVGVVNVGLWGLLVWRMQRVLGRRSAIVVAAVGALSPTWVAFSFALWGDLIGGQVAVLLVLALVAVQRAVETGRDAAWRWLVLGAGVGALVYVRPNFVLLLPVLLVVTLAIHLDALEWRRGLGRALRAGLLASLAFAVCLAPWSIPLSLRMGGVYPTTTSIDLNLLLAFTPPSRWNAMVETLPPHAGGSLLRYYRHHFEPEMARRGLSYHDLVREEQARLLAGVTPESYAAGVRRNVDDYLFDQNVFLDRFERLTSGASPGGAASRAWAGFDALNSAVWYACLLLGFVGLVVPWGLAGRLFWLVPALQLTCAAAAIQPFVSVAHTRHAVALLPILTAILAAAMTTAPRWLLRPDDPHPTPGRRLLVAAQRGTSVLVVAGVVLVWWGGG